MGKQLNINEFLCYIPQAMQFVKTTKERVKIVNPTPDLNNLPSAI